MRYAFLTTEFPTTLHGAGGLATYTRRMARLLTEAGHSVEVFVLDRFRSDVVEFEEFHVRHVRQSNSRFSNLRNSVLDRFGQSGFVMRAQLLRDAAVMASALETRHSEAPFDVVQSPDYRAIGLRVPKRKDRVHVVRCSAAMDLYMEADGRTEPRAHARVQFERKAVESADIAIAPSQLVATHYEKLTGRSVKVVRPPAFLEITPSARPNWLVPRYLVHFAGNLGKRKGTELLMEAIPKVLKEEPLFTMYCFGNISQAQRATYSAQVPSANIMFGHPLSKGDLYAVVQGAQAAVLPSLVDNIPNTLIESLLLNTPVIVTSGSSLDEIVENSETARVVSPNSSDELAGALLSAWRGELKRQAGDWIKSLHGVDFTSSKALQNHLTASRER